MSSARHQPASGYPAIPQTLAADNHELKDYEANHHGQATSTPYYTPYLGLRARLSQVWINRWTILLLLILVRLLMSIASIDDDLGRAKTEALQACTSVEKAGSTMASMPHYLSEGVNALAADGVTAAVNALMKMLTLTITGVQELILFVINMLTSTYVCLITLVIRGSLSVALDVLERATKFFTDEINKISEDLSGAVGDFETGFNSFLDNINIGGIFGDDADPPSIDLGSEIEALKAVDIDPTTFLEDLDKFNASIPTFADVQNFTNTAIRFPFEQVKKLINESMSTFTFDKSVFPVAEKKALTFCTDNPAINNFFDGLVNVVSNARKIFLIVLIIAAVLVCIPMAYREIWRWRTMKQRAQLIQQNAFDPMDVIYISSRPYTTTFGIKAASKFKSTRKQILIRWFVAYATSVPALFVLSLGIAGLFSCLCQYIVLKVIEREAPKLATEIGDFTGIVVLALNNASEEWAISSNGVIDSTNKKINDDVFGWVNTSTTAVNDTLNTFTEEMSKTLDTVFGDSIFKDPVAELLNCLIGLKIAAVQKGLTWASDNAKIDFPNFRPDVFSLGAAASLTESNKDDSFLASPGAVASDDITSAVVKVSNKLQRMILQEAIISACVVGLWFLIMLIGLGRVIFGMIGRDKTRAEGGPGLTGDHRAPISPRSPNRGDAARFPAFGGPVSSVHPEKSSDDMHAWASGGGGGGGGVEEKFGRTGHRSVEANTKPGQHERVSSYGRVSGYEKH